MTKQKINRREFLRLSAMVAVGATAAACARPTPQVVEKQVPVEKVVKETVIVEKQVPVEKVVKETVIVEKPIVVEKVVVPTPVKLETYKEAPMLTELVKAGKLPPVEQRLPKNPKVLPVYEKIGKYGGTWRRAYRGVSDRFGVHTTICEHLLEMYEPAGGGTLALIPNVAESYEVNADATEFTWHLREGMKWSDGTELTSADAVWWYQNIYLNEEIAPGHLYDNVRQQKYLIGIEAKGKYAFVCKYSQPNGTLPIGVVRGEAWGLIGGLNFMAPGHYLSKYHKSTADPKFLEETLAKYKLQKWNQLFLEGPIAMFALNPELPVVGPWVTKVPAGTGRMVQERNPYYFQVDPEGNQLPYIDQVTHDFFENQESFNLMLISGQVDCQFRHVQLKDYSLLKENEKKGNYKVYVWRADDNTGYLVNPTPRNDDGTVDEVQAAIVSRADFRKALSLAINRKEINDLLFNGLAYVRQSSPIPGSPVWKKEYEEAYAQYDPEQANKLLDGLGLTKRDAEGFRLRPDGKTLTLRMDVDNVPGAVEMDMDQLVKGYWEKIGIKVVINAMERSLRETVQFSDRYSVVRSGLANTAVPLSYDAWHNTIGGGWGRYIRYGTTDPLAIKPPENDPEVQAAMKAYKIIEEAYGMADVNAAHAKLMEALDIIYTYLFGAIGIVGASPVPGVVTNRMKNVPNGLIWGNALMRINMGQPAQFFIEE